MKHQVTFYRREISCCVSRISSFKKSEELKLIVLEETYKTVTRGRWKLNSMEIYLFRALIDFYGNTNGIWVSLGKAKEANFSFIWKDSELQPLY